jgi:hypothetical protein
MLRHAATKKPYRYTAERLRGALAIPRNSHNVAELVEDWERPASAIFFDLFLRLSAKLHTMTNTLTAHIQRKRAERELFNARQTLSHLVDMYDSGKWRRFYGEDVFAGMVRQARESVDRWTDVLGKCD